MIAATGPDAPRCRRCVRNLTIGASSRWGDTVVDTVPCLRGCCARLRWRLPGLDGCPRRCCSGSCAAARVPSSHQRRRQSMPVAQLRGQPMLCINLSTAVGLVRCAAPDAASRAVRATPPLLFKPPSCAWVAIGLDTWIAPVSSSTYPPHRQAPACSWLIPSRWAQPSRAEALRSRSDQAHGRTAADAWGLRRTLHHVRGSVHLATHHSAM